MSDRRGVAAAVALSVVAGLALAGSSTAVWVEEAITRSIAGATVGDTVATRGVEFAGLALPAGIAMAAAGVLLAMLGQRLRRVLSVGIALLSVVAGVDVARGLVTALDAAGSLTPAPGLAVVGVLVGLGGALGGLRGRRRPQLPARFDLDADEDDEWSAAVDPGEDER